MATVIEKVHIEKKQDIRRHLNVEALQHITDKNGEGDIVGDDGKIQAKSNDCENCKRSTNNISNTLKENTHLKNAIHILNKKYIDMIEIHSLRK